MATTLLQSFRTQHLVAAVLSCMVTLSASAAHSQAHRLVGGESLTAGESITSLNGVVSLVQQHDGNLVLYRLADGYPLWNSRTNGRPGAFTAMQTDGNLVVYGTNGAPLFNTGTQNNPGSSLELQTDSNLVIYSVGGVTLWNTGTNVPTVSYSTPAYEPNYWNANSTTRSRNNCYNYSNNKRTDTFAQPGRAHGVSGYAMSVAAVRSAAIADGLVPTTSSATSSDGKTKIALVVAPGYDYHWYRQDSNGMWTHKPGGTNATNLDNSGVTISNPESANRGPYTDFGGYFFTPSDAAQGQGKAVIN
jgi:hypothetical protein